MHNRAAAHDGASESLHQPQVDLEQRTIFGAEVLLRWRHPGGALLLPDDFVSVAEGSGLMYEIGAWVLRTTCQRAAAWRAAGMPAVTLSINGSPRQLLGQELAPLLSSVLAETGLDPATLVLEITESATMHDIARVAALLQ